MIEYRSFLNISQFKKIIMQTNPLHGINIYDLLMSRNLISIHPNQHFPVRGSTTKTPIRIESLNWVQPNNMICLAEEVSSAIAYCKAKREEENKEIEKENVLIEQENQIRTEKMKLKRKKNAITAVSGSKFSEILAYKVSEITGLKFLPVNKNNAVWNNLEGEQVIHINDVIGTGRTLSEAVDQIRDAGGLCEEAVSVFDYCFHLTRQSGGLKVYSLLNMHDLIRFPDQIIKKWAEEENMHKNLLRKVDPAQKQNAGLQLTDIMG